MKIGERSSSEQRVEQPPTTVAGETRLTLLSGFDLAIGGQVAFIPMGAQRLLAFLALNDRPLRRRYVAESLWPDTSEVRAGANLRSVLWRLRRPSEPLIQMANQHLRLDSGMSVDVRDSVARARRILDRAATLDEGDVDVGPLSFDLLPNWSDDWVLVNRERFRQLRLHALEALCERLTEANRFAQAVEAGLAAVAADPLRESAQRALIRAYLAEGNRRDAINEYRAFRRLLSDELGLPPSPEIERLVQSLSQPAV